VTGRCKECRFWNKALRMSVTDYTGKGTVQVEAAQCRRYAPVPHRDGRVGKPWGAWPTVTAADWCGEFERQAK
jgi:hypothetical protein